MATSSKKTTRSKMDALREHGTLNPRPSDVGDPAFADSDFFDPCDMVQVKYEMLRRVRAEGCTVRETASQFGVSRPTYYSAKANFDRDGMIGLLPGKRGPRGAHKLTDEVMEFLEGELASEPGLGSRELASRIEERFGLEVHPRSVERGLQRRKKNRP
jgi:transposase